MSNLTLKRKILLSISLALLSVIMLLSGFSYMALREQVIEGSYQQISRLSTYSTNAISAWLNSKVGALAALYKSDKYLDPATQRLVGEASDFIGIYHGDNHGNMIDDDPADNATSYRDYKPQEEAWFKAGVGHSTPVLTPPYRDETYTPPAIVLSVVQATPSGVLGGDITTERVQQLLAETKLPAQGSNVLIDGNGNIIAYQDQRLVLKPLYELITGADIPKLTSALHQDDPLEVTQEGKTKLLWARPIANSQWILLSIVDKQQLLAPLQNQLIQQLIISVLVLVVSLLAIGALFNLLFRPLLRVSAALSHIASGDGDLTQRIPIQSQDEVGQLASNFNQFVGSLHELIGHIRHEAEIISTAASHGLTRSAETVHELSRQQQEITLVATAITQMASATVEIAHNAENTAAGAQQSTNSSLEGLNLVTQSRGSITNLANEVGEATAVIVELNRHAEEISSVLATIKGIAEQTNLLALNAAIEAARAGDQGRGFAVVADEVRVLSRRTQASTTEIQATIETLQKTTQQAVTMMEKSQSLAQHSVRDAEAAAKALEEITQAVSLISDMSTQIATAAEEQTKVTEEITANVTAIKEVSDELTAGAHEEQQESHALQQQAEQLNEKVARFIL